MGLEELKKHISNDMNEKVKEIEKNIKIQVESILKNAKKRVKVYEKSREESFEKEKDEMTLREDALVELEGNKLVQEARKKSIDLLFDELKNKLLNLTKLEKTKLLKSLLNKANSEIEVNTVYVSKNDKELLKNSKVENIIGGLIAENKDASIRVDYSFDSLINEFRQQILLELSNKLFD